MPTWVQQVAVAVVLLTFCLWVGWKLYSSPSED